MLRVHHAPRLQYAHLEAARFELACLILGACIGTLWAGLKGGS